MDTAECRQRFGSARVARLATLGPTGPHLVPIVFGLNGDVVVTAVDDKPKRSRRLQRLANIANNPAVSLLVDVYDDDWDRLWWVRADGIARVVGDAARMQPALDLLIERYEQYRRLQPQGPVIEVTVTRWSGWSAR
jgi:PPOX class probable F420-dependent enzyme